MVEPVATSNSRQPWREAMRPGCRAPDCLPTFIAGRLSVSLSFGGMKHLAAVYQRRSLTFATIALLFGLAALGRTVNFVGLAHQYGRDFVQQSLVICVVTLVLCIAVLSNLVLDVRRGYSPSRCSLAAVVMLAAFTGPVMLAFALVAYYSR